MPPQHRTGERGARRLAPPASTLLGPATIVVALGLLLPILILFRYSLNKFEPRVMMVEAVTLENYVKFFTDPVLHQHLLDDAARGAAVHAGLPGAGVSAGLRAGAHARAATRTC